MTRCLRLNVTASIDAKVWLSSVPRGLWQCYHDYVVGTTKASSRLRLPNLVIRGFTPWRKACFSSGHGHITASLTTICVDILCQAKRDGLLVGEGAVIASLIDDGVISVEIDHTLTKEQQEEVAD